MLLPPAMSSSGSEEQVGRGGVALRQNPAARKQKPKNDIMTIIAPVLCQGGLHNSIV